MANLSTAGSLYLGSTAVDRVYLGSMKVWPPFSPVSFFANGEDGAVFEIWNSVFTDPAGTQPAVPADRVGSLMSLVNGYSGSQATASKRPIYGIVPATGRRNLLDSSVALSGWSRVSGFSNSGRVLSFIDNPASRSHLNISIPGTESYIGSATFSPEDVGKKVRIGIWASNYNALSPGDAPNLTIPEDGFVHIKYTDVKNVTNFGIINSTDGEAQTLTLADNKGIQLAVATDDFRFYQDVISKHEITQEGVRSLHYLRSDLVDDSLPVTLPDLGTNATVWYANEDGITIQIGQAVSGEFETLRGEKTYAVGAIDRALTHGEGVDLRSYLNKKRGAAKAYNPLTLFESGEVGDAWMPNRETCYTKTSGGVYEPVTTSGDLVARWAGSINGINADQDNTPKRPFYMEGGGLTWLKFDGVDDTVMIPNSAFNFTGDQAIWIAAKHATGIGSYIYLMGNRGDSGFLFVTAAPPGRMRFLPVTTNASGPVSPSPIGTGSIVFEGTWERYSGDMSLRENGVVVNTGSKIPADVSIPSGGYTGLGEGAAGGAKWDGNVYGVIVRDTLFTAEETENTDAYLADKSGALL